MREAFRRYQEPLKAPSDADLRNYFRGVAPAPPAYRAIRDEAKRNGVSDLTMRQIDEEVSATRRNLAGKKKNASR